MKLFGTDGIRSKANEYPLVPEFVVRIGQSIPEAFMHKSNTVIIGGDTRQSTGMISSALVSGVTSRGLNVVVGNIMPTPIVAFFTRKFKFRCGIVVSASHNPWDDNGIKFFTPEGVKLTPEEEKRFEKIIFSMKENRSGGSHTGNIFHLLDWRQQYIEHLKQCLELELSKLKLVIDYANGATITIASDVFASYGCKPISINDAANGKNINENCGAEHPEALQNAVKKNRADIGFAYDGDGDRVVVVDSYGNILDGDALINIIAGYLSSKGKLNGVVITKYSNLGLVKALEARNIPVEYAATGDRYVAELMRKRGYQLGGEKAGHIILGDFETTGNGLLVSLFILKIMLETGKPLHELNTLKEVPQVMINVAVKRKVPFEELPAVQRAIEQAKGELGSDGRVFVRYSGTQPVARVMVEATRKASAQFFAERIARAIKEGD